MKIIINVTAGKIVTVARFSAEFNTGTLFRVHNVVTVPTTTAVVDVITVLQLLRLVKFLHLL